MLQYESIPDAVRELLGALSASAVVEGFALGGGTSLALRFGHRVSVDLDFFSVNAFDPEELVTREGFPPKHTVLGRSDGSLTVEINSVKIDFLRHDYPLLEPMELTEGMNLLSLSDVTAMKLNAIVNRGSTKDFFDLVRSLEDTRLDSCLDLFERKYPNTDRFVVIRSLAWFEDAEEEPDPLVPTNLDWEDVKVRITQAVEKLN